jgi:hypothetical protein
MKNAHVSNKAAALVLSVVTIAGISAWAQPVKHVLNGTYYAVAPAIATSCSTENCVATTNVYNESIPCPGATGVKCTYEVNIAGDLYGASAAAQFLVDNAAPSGGGTDQNGFYGDGWSFIYAYSVTSQVENASKNQPHTIVINLGCTAEGGQTGCASQSLPISVTIRVLKP